MGQRTVLLIAVFSAIFFESAIGIEKIVAKGIDCAVTEPLYNNKFNLTGLRSDLEHVFRSDRNDKFEMNVCGPMTKPCGIHSNVFACFSTGSRSFVLGYRHELWLEDGRIHFNFTGERCNDRMNYTLNMILQCSYEHPKDPIVLFPYAENECSFYGIWTSNHSCLEQKTVATPESCTVVDSTGLVYNLKSLDHSNHRISDRKGSYFIMNICRPVLYGYESMCPPDSSVCFVNSTALTPSTRYNNHGSVGSNLILEHNRVTMHLSSNTKCNENQNYSSNILFICNPSIHNEEPEYLGLHGCEHKFDWQTSVVCINLDPCVAIDPVSGFKYDFGSLSNKQYTLSTAEKKSYVFSVCSAPKAPCLENAGACENTNGLSIALGIANDALLLNASGVPYLMYNSGSVCQRIHHQWKTKIEFICGEVEGPRLVENSDCILIVQFVTPLACQEQISCKATNFSSEKEIDLTPLINSKSNYLAEVSEHLNATEGYPIQYFINVCRPLVPQYGLSCTGGSAACRALLQNNTHKEEESLGYPEVSLTIVDTPNGSRAHLKYFDGSICRQDPLEKLSSVVEFYCDVQSGIGAPKLESIVNDCQYEFSWATNVICPIHVCSFRDNTCILFNDQLGVDIDLQTVVTENGVFKVKTDKSSFDVNLCNTGYSVLADYSQGAVKMFFDLEQPCGNEGKISAEVHITCAELTTQMVISNIDECSLVLILNTPLICPMIGRAVSIQDDRNIVGQPIKSTDIENGFNFGGIIAFFAMIALIFAAVLVLRNPLRRVQLVQMFRRKDVSVQYSRVHTVEEASLLIPHLGNGSDSDDELLI